MIFDILALFDSSPLIQNSKFNNFLWACWFLGKNLSNLVSLVWKLHNLHCHNERSWIILLEESRWSQNSFTVKKVNFARTLKDAKLICSIISFWRNQMNTEFLYGQKSQLRIESFKRFLLLSIVHIILMYFKMYAILKLTQPSLKIHPSNIHTLCNRLLRTLTLLL